MCWCNPEIRTPNCGKTNCIPPQPSPTPEDRKMSEWIKVEDRLPSKNELVVAYCRASKEHSGASWNRDGVALIPYHANDTFTERTNEVRDRLDADLFTVTHWMPLPPAPSTQGGGE